MSDSDSGMSVDVPVPTKLKSKAKSKGKDKAKPTAKAAQYEDVDSDEEVDIRHAPYSAPAPFKEYENIDVDDNFDWDRIESDQNLELWLIRVPDSFKSKQLEGVSLQVPSSSHSKLGTVSRKSGAVTHLVMCVDRGEDTAAAEELDSLRCLLPRKRKAGKMFLAQKKFAQHVVVTRVPTTPTLDPEHSASSTTVDLSAATRPSWPLDQLNGRFVPCGLRGAQTESVDGDEESDEDMEVAAPTLPAKASLPVPTSAPPSPAREKKDKKEKKKDKKDKEVVEEEVHTSTAKPPKKRKLDDDVPAGKKAKKAKLDT